jgi:hypothetical protein
MTEAINPNVNVGEESNSESKVGEITSFDQLDRITDDQIRGKRQEKKQEKAEATPEAETKEVTPQEPQGTAADAEVVPSLGIDPESIKPIQLSHGEEKYNILPTAEVPVKIDGEKQTVPLQELLNNYSGKVAYDKRFNELNQEKQSFTKERRQFVEEKEFVEGKINKFHELSQEDPIQAFDYLCEIAGKDPIEFQKTFRDNLVKKFEDYYNLDDIGKREFNLTEQERLLERKRQSETDRTAKAQQAQAEQQKLEAAISQYGIDQDRYFEVYDDLQKASPQGTIEPQHVVRYERALLAQKVVSEVRPDKAQDTQVLGELAAVLVQNPEFKEDDLRGILAEIWKDEPSQTSKDLSQKVLKTQAQAKQDQKPKSTESVPWSFDQV